VHEIDQWHQECGFSRDDVARQRINPQLHAIGYHFVIYPNGANATGRDVGEIGAHAKNFNARTISICLIGTDKFTREQWWTLRDIVVLLRIKHLDARVIGQRDLPNVKKTCPGCSSVGCANRREAHPTELVSLNLNLDFFYGCHAGNRQNQKPMAN
jgi:N-acetylmuramoyl-L-alanine amidase